jgi:hypothetical protein
MRSASPFFVALYPISIFGAVIVMPAPSIAGPPFKTDDPQPVDFLHWEFYLASMQEIAASEVVATLPHIEVNYGIAQNVQLHLLCPMGFVRLNGGAQYGYSDTEFGVKYRFIQESDDVPQIGTFPLLEIPTGNKTKELGSGSFEVFLPLWFQKSWGSLTTYGGGGLWFNPGSGNRNWLFAGWEVQYDFSESLTIGGEFTYSSPPTIGTHSDAGFSLGGYFNITRNDHFLFSVGRTFADNITTTGYLGFLLTI